MTRIARTLSLLLFGLACVPSIAAGCGGSPYADKCTLACEPKVPCAGTDPTVCQARCETTLDALQAACAQCVLEHSGWSGTTCTCDMTGCSRCTYPGGECVGGDLLTCDPAQDNTCSGFELGKTSGSACMSVCSTG